MKLYTTTIRAICPHTGELKTYAGSQVLGDSFEDAQAYCDNHGLGYCQVDGELIAEIPITQGEPDFDRMINYDTLG